MTVCDSTWRVEHLLEHNQSCLIGILSLTIGKRAVFQRPTLFLAVFIVAIENIDIFSSLYEPPKIVPYFRRPIYGLFVCNSTS
jgi:hypothetical protein